MPSTTFDWWSCFGEQMGPWHVWKILPFDAPPIPWQHVIACKCRWSWSSSLAIFRWKPLVCHRAGRDCSVSLLDSFWPLSAKQRLQPVTSEDTKTAWPLVWNGARTVDTAAHSHSPSHRRPQLAEQVVYKKIGTSTTCSGRVRDE